MTFKIIITHIFPENFIEIPQVVQKLLGLKLTETGNVCVITHHADLEERFPGNELISDEAR